MMKVLATALTTAFVATVANAATTIDDPLPYGIYEGATECNGDPIETGTISSVTAMDEDGTFCENTIHHSKDGLASTEVYTKVKFVSCNAMAMGAVFLDAYACSDASCMECTDADGMAVEAQLMVPKFDPLPAADTCWGTKAMTTGVAVLTKFDKGSDEAAIDAYWRLYSENSCLGEAIQAVSDDSALSSASVASKALATAMGVVLVAFLLN